MTFIHYIAGHARSSALSIASADSVMGSSVVDQQGLRVGELRDIMLDLSTGRIAYAVIAMESRGNVSGGNGDHLIVVPWNAIHPDHDGQTLRVNAHADWIGRAPSVQQGHAPDRFVQEWGAFIHTYFGTRPYWEPAPAKQHS